jgi:protein involved in ribonucleotide reduction
MALNILTVRHLRAFLTLLVWESFVVCDGTVSIASSNAFITQRPCIRGCIMGASNGIDVGCGSPFLNSCFCRADLQSSALYQVSSCVSVNCNGTATDINNAISLYTAYCSTATLSTMSAAASSSDAVNDPTVSMASPNAYSSTATLSTTSATAAAANTTATNSGTENDPTVSITSSNAYATQRPCVQDCIMGASNGIDVGCGNPLLNSCFCRADLQSSAVYQVSSCVSVNCNGATTDINNAISLYTVYCSSDTLTAGMAATGSPGEAQPSVTSSGSGTAQSTGESCS